MDADGPEGGWLRELDGLLTAGHLGVRTMIIEGSDLDPRLMRRFQTVHGYMALRLDAEDGRRWISEDGWDA